MSSSAKSGQATYEETAAVISAAVAMSSDALHRAFATPAKGPHGSECACPSAWALGPLSDKFIA